MLNTAFINLKTLVNNAKKVKKLLPESTKFCAVVKADAYGHGASKCANALYNVVDCFAVAIVEEGISLRLSGIDKDILVFTPCFLEDLKKAVEYSLTLTVCSILDIKRLEEEGKRQNKTVKVHIKYNTGMNRNGVDGLKNLKKIMDYSLKCKYVKIEGLYSHYAHPENEKSLNTATYKFMLAKDLVKGYNNKVLSHISASGGTLKGKYFDMVRVGILLYGYKPFEFPIKVRPVMKIVAPVITTRKLKCGDRALYNEKRISRDTQISIVRYGYADGLSRKEIKGQFNNRCMDVTAVKTVKRHRKITVLYNADILAKRYKTISYEILTKAAVRAEKKYLY